MRRFRGGAAGEAEGRREKWRGARRGEKKIFSRCGAGGGGGAAAALFHPRATSGGPRGSLQSPTGGHGRLRAHASAGGCGCGCAGREILIRECPGLGLWAGVGDRLLALLTWP